MTEQAGQASMCAKAPGRHGAQRYCQLAGDLGVGQRIEMLQPDQFAVLSRQVL
jgi:hypothetical protein